MVVKFGDWVLIAPKSKFSGVTRENERDFCSVSPLAFSKKKSINEFEVLVDYNASAHIGLLSIGRAHVPSHQCMCSGLGTDLW